MQLHSAGSVVQAQAPSALAVCQASSAALLLLSRVRGLLRPNYSFKRTAAGRLRYYRAVRGGSRLTQALGRRESLLSNVGSFRLAVSRFVSLLL